MKHKDDERADEGNIYRCEWRKTRRGFRLQLTDRPEISSEAESIAECRESLAEMVMDRIGDCTPQFEFEGNAPGLPERFSKPDIRIIWHDHAAIRKTPVHELYEGGACQVCGECVGKRTEAILQVVSLPAHAISLQIGTTPIVVCSEVFLEEMEMLGSDRFEFRPITTLPKFPSRTRYIELIPVAPDALVSPVAVKGLEDALQAWQCEACGAGGRYYDLDGQYFQFVPHGIAAEALRKPFLFGGSLCVAGETWRSARDRLGLSQIQTVQMGVVPDAEVDPNPRSEIRREALAPVPFRCRKPPRGES